MHKIEQVARILDTISKTDTIIIDEISMCHKDQMDLIEHRLQQANFQGNCSSSVISFSFRQSRG